MSLLGYDIEKADFVVVMTCPDCGWDTTIYFYQDTTFDGITCRSDCGYRFPTVIGVYAASSA